MDLAFSLTPTPPANAFLQENQLKVAEESYPLDLFLCSKCGHLQLLDIVDPRFLFEHYVYVSGTSPVFVRHFESYAEDAVRRSRAKRGDLVVEIGSNDGTLLRFFKQAGLHVLGIDPAKKIAAEASASGVDTWPEFFTQSTASRISSSLGSAKIICANNVFAHIDDLKGIVTAIRSLLAEDGIFVFEASYLLDIYEKTLFDTIYHEHLDYHRVRPLDAFFKTQGLELIDARRVDTHGGSLRGIVQRRGGPFSRGPAVGMLEKRESELGLDRLETFRDFARRIDARRQELSSLIAQIKREGKTVAGFGAPAKATTLMHHFRLDGSVLDFIADSSPLKQGLFTPGLHVPVLPPKTIEERHPDYVLILAWNFAPSIMESLASYRKAGGRFIIPLPEVTVV